MNQDERHPLEVLHELFVKEVEEHSRDYGNLVGVLFYLEMSDATFKALLAKSPFHKAGLRINVNEGPNDYYNRTYVPKEKICGTFYGMYTGFVCQHNEHPKGKVILRKAFNPTTV